MSSSLSLPSGEFHLLDESARLNALRRLEILDTAPEIAFDRLTALASQIFGAPVALVTLIDAQRQWFKSAHGVDICETSRELSFCIHNLDSEDVLVVPDATLDPRFCDNAFVVGPPHVRFYAGARINSPQGIAVGRLCVLDVVPRDFSEQECETLRGLAAIVSDELELRLTTRRLEREIEGRRAFQKALQNAEVRFEDAFQHSAIGMALLSPQGDYLRVNKVFCQLIGYSEANLMMLSFRALTHPNDLSASIHAIKKLMAGESTAIELEKRYRHRDGHDVMTLVSLSMAQGEDGASPVIIAQVQDISARRHAENALRESQALKAAILDTALDSIITIDGRDEIVEWNPAAEKTFGYTRAQAVGAKFHQLVVPPEFHDLHLAGMTRFAATGEMPFLGQRVELPALHADGSCITFESSIVPIRGADGPLFTLHMRDVTERGRTQERLRLLESVAVHANDAILITQAEPLDSPGPQIVYANQAFLKMTGYSLDEIIGQTPRILHGPDTSREVGARIRAGLEKWEVVEAEVLNYRKDGTPFWVELSIVPIANESGWFTHWVSVQRDITERKRIDAQLRESQSRYQRIAANVPGMVYQLSIDENENHQFLYVSDGCREIYGLEPEQVIADSKLMMNHVHPDDAKGFLDSVAASMHTLQAWEWQGRVMLPNQPLKWISGSARPRREGKSVVWDGLLFDITARKAEEAILQAAKAEAEAAKEEAERANLAKSGFLSRMSHELRTPLNAILGFGQLLEMAPLDESDAQSANQILKAGRHLLDLINEVLDIARIESGQVALSPEAVRVSEIGLEVLDLVRPLAAARGIRFNDHSIRHCNCYIRADRQRLKQVLLNLLSNAVKYNREGGVVSFSCSGEGEQLLGQSDAIQLRVSDTGMGIEAELHGRLFTPFDRLGAERTRVEGTGMGLALSRRLAEAMGGQLDFSSVVGQGSTFWIELPRAIDPVAQLAEFAVAEPETPVVTTQLVVLYIEDNPSNLELVQRLLSHRPDIRLLTAMQGGLGYELARQHCPDLILLDINLPDVSGTQVLARLRSDDITDKIPVIVVSADATSGQVERLLRAGAYKYLTKPFEVRELIALLDEQIRINLMNRLCEIDVQEDGQDSEYQDNEYKENPSTPKSVAAAAATEAAAIRNEVAMSQTLLNQKLSDHSTANFPAKPVEEVGAG